MNKCVISDLIDFFQNEKLSQKKIYFYQIESKG